VYAEVEDAYGSVRVRSTN